MTISIDVLIEAVSESVEKYNANVYDAIHETIDGALVYGSDIVEYWISAGMPDPEDMGAHDSIIDAITSAVYLDLYDRISEKFSGEETE